MQAAALILLYLNADGGTFQPGADDAAADTSSLLAETARIPAWSHQGRMTWPHPGADLTRVRDDPPPSSSVGST